MSHTDEQTNIQAKTSQHLAAASFVLFIQFVCG